MEQLLEAVEEQADKDGADDELTAKLMDAAERAQSEDINVRTEGKVDLILLTLQQLSTAVQSSRFAKMLGL